MVIGETAEYQWDYSETSDIFNIHKKGKKVSGSAELGDFTIDFDKARDVVGLEIMNVKNFFQDSQVSEEQLLHIKSAEVLVKHSAGVFYIWIKLILPNSIEKRIPIPAPVLEEAVA